MWQIQVNNAIFFGELQHSAGLKVMTYEKFEITLQQIIF